jgi:hypothetical protein
VMLVIVTDAFGGLGGIARYNRDFPGVLAEKLCNGSRSAAASARSPRAAESD